MPTVLSQLKHNLKAAVAERQKIDKVIVSLEAALRAYGVELKEDHSPLPVSKYKVRTPGHYVERVLPMLADGPKKVRYLFEHVRKLPGYRRMGRESFESTLKGELDNPSPRIRRVAPGTYGLPEASKGQKTA
jgi:hypothetical protein